MAQAAYTDEEVVLRGEALYEQQIRPRIAASDHGKFLVLDIQSGDYEVDAS